jgi:miniconductance mechanosensitive channel
MGMNITEILGQAGITSPAWMAVARVAIIVAIIALAALMVYIVTKKLVAKVLIRIIHHTYTRWDDVFFSGKIFSRLGLLLAAVVVGIIVSGKGLQAPPIITRLASVAITVTAVMMIAEVLYGINRVYETFSQSKEHPVKIIMQVVVIFLWIAALMIVIHIFTGKSIGWMLGGLTAFAAVLMLIFQDSILGFVAGIQFGANNMLRIGDWIEMPGRGVDGDVIEINLTTVKVQNWDKTITTIPTHKLVSESFTNWRGMQESQGRRIKRSVSIDVNTIHYLTEAEIEAARGSSLLNAYMENKLAEIGEFNRNRDHRLDERRLTNIGTFREYLETWLEQNPDVNTDMTHMVRQLQPGPTGLPIEVYCFSARQKWVEYERVQADIFDHIYAVMPLFGLRAFEYSGAVVAP